MNDAKFGPDEADTDLRHVPHESVQSAAAFVAAHVEMHPGDRGYLEAWGKSSPHPEDALNIIIHDNEKRFIWIKAWNMGESRLSYRASEWPEGFPTQAPSPGNSPVG